MKIMFSLAAVVVFTLSLSEASTREKLKNSSIVYLLSGIMMLEVSRARHIKIHFEHFEIMRK